MPRFRSVLPMLLVAASAAVALVALVRGPHWRVDDAYIVARYAENWVHHGQLTWNINDPPVEGFTGYTLLGVMAIASLLHIPPIGATIALGIAALFVGAALLYSSHEPLGGSKLAGAIAASIFLCAAEQHTHAMSGLETELFIVLTIACATAAARRSHHEPGAGRLWPLPLLTLACIFTRPEGLAVGGAFLLPVLLRERLAWRRWLPWIATILVLPVATLHIFRRLYFGDWLPNTYYAKLGKAGAWAVFGSSFSKHAQAYLVPALVAMIATVIVARALGNAITPWSDSVRSARRVFLTGALMSYAAVGWSYLRSEMVMNYSERFAFHLFGLSALLVLLAVAEIERHFRAIRHVPAIRSCTFVLASVSLYLLFANALQRLPGERNYRDNYQRATNTHYIAAARWLEENVPPHATLAVYPDAGIVPYSTHLRTIDFGKLNDAYLAREAHDAAAVVDYFFRINPDVLMIYCHRGLEKTYDETGDRILADPRFVASYQLTMMSLRDGGGTALFVKR